MGALSQVGRVLFTPISRIDAVVAKWLNAKTVRKVSTLNDGQKKVALDSAYTEATRQHTLNLVARRKSFKEILRRTTKEPSQPSQEELAPSTYLSSHMPNQTESSVQGIPNALSTPLGAQSLNDEAAKQTTEQGAMNTDNSEADAPPKPPHLSRNKLRTQELNHHFSPHLQPIQEVDESTDTVMPTFQVEQTAPATSLEPHQPSQSQSVIKGNDAAREEGFNQQKISDETKEAEASEGKEPAMKQDDQDTPVDPAQEEGTTHLTKQQRAKEEALKRLQESAEKHSASKAKATRKDRLEKRVSSLQITQAKETNSRGKESPYKYSERLATHKNILNQILKKAEYRRKSNSSTPEENEIIRHYQETIVEIDRSIKEQKNTFNQRFDKDSFSIKIKLAEEILFPKRERHNPMHEIKNEQHRIQLENCLRAFRSTPENISDEEISVAYVAGMKAGKITCLSHSDQDSNKHLLTAKKFIEVELKKKHPSLSKFTR